MMRYGETYPVVPMTDSETTTDGIPGVRPDKAQIRCTNCGYIFEAIGKPNRTPPMTYVSADCGDCPVRGTVKFNQYRYIAGTLGEIAVKEVEG